MLFNCIPDIFCAYLQFLMMTLLSGASFSMAKPSVALPAAELSNAASPGLARCSIAWCGNALQERNKTLL